jgi:hypothetical protein
MVQMGLTKIIFLVATVCPSTLAVDHEDSCDETSLVQVKQVVKHRNGGASLAEIPNEADGVPTPVHDDKAISDSTLAGLDAGQVDAAFDTNADKIKSQIQSKAADMIDFTNKQRLQRDASDEAAKKQVVENAKAVSEAIAAENAAVAKATAERKKIQDAAYARVKAAEENAEAHYIKRQQAQNAAALGREVGKIEGTDAAVHAWADYQDDVADQQAQEERESEKKQLDAQEASNRAAVQKQTNGLKAENAEWVAESNHDRDEEMAHAAAEAGEEEEDAAGAEGLNNKLTSMSKLSDTDLNDSDGDVTFKELLYEAMLKNASSRFYQLWGPNTGSTHWVLTHTGEGWGEGGIPGCWTSAVGANGEPFATSLEYFDWVLSADTSCEINWLEGTSSPMHRDGIPPQFPKGSAPALLGFDQTIFDFCN